MPEVTRRETLKLVLAAGAGAFAERVLAADEVVRLSFLLVNDFYEIDESKNQRGGLARLAAVVEAERARASAERRTLVFAHAGDTLSPSLMSSIDSGAHMVALFNEIGLDAFVPGNHEFDFGKEVYLQRMGEANFPILAANLRDHGGAPLPRHQDRLIHDAGGLKIALIGSAYDQTTGVSRPGDLTFAPTILTIRQEAERARGAGADFVVAIVHADKATCASLMNGHVADLILSGHNHDLHIDFDGRTAWMESQADAFYVNAVDLDIAISATDKTRRLSWWPTFHPIDTKNVVPAPAFVEKVRAFEAQLAKSFNVEIATLGAPLDSRTETVRSEEAAIGDLFADALRQATSAEIALINGGAIRGNRIYPAGTRLTRRDIVTELPFGNKAIVASIPGKAVRAALENGFSQLDRLSGRFPQLSGLAVTVDRSAPLGKRVQDVLVHGEPLDPARPYRLATDDFLAQGGDGYWMFAGEIKVGADSGIRLVSQDVTTYVEGLKVVDAKREGRIVFR